MSTHTELRHECLPLHIIHHCQKVGTAHMAIEAKRLHTAWYIHTMEYYLTIKKPVRKRLSMVGFHLYKRSRIGKSRETIV